MGSALKVLFVEDSENDVSLILNFLQTYGYNVTYERICSTQDMHAALADQTWDVVLSDYEMPGFGGKAALKIFLESGSSAPFILVSGDRRRTGRGYDQRRRQ
jgi:two-component system cell cycle sensor histidine kinase/response regulator CckA